MSATSTAPTASASISATDAGSARRRDRLVFLTTWALTAALGILWALATPVGASPDEPAHLIKAASVARGQLVGEPSHYGHVVQVPRYVAASHDVACIAFHSDIPADCIDATPDDPGAIVDATTTAGLYNPVYYALVGWPSLLFGDVAGLYGMRVTSAVLTGLFVALGARIVMGLGRPALSLAAVGVAATPTLLFLSGAVNPNAIEVTATLAAFVAMLAIVRRPRGAPLGGLVAVAAVSAVVGVQMRGLSPLWMAVALLAPLVLIPWARIRALLARRVVWVLIAVVGVGVGAAVLWTLGSSSLTGALADEEHFQQYPGVGTSPLRGFGVMLLDTFNHGTQMIASFGWLDTPAPQAVYFAWSAFIGALGLAGVAVLRGRGLAFGALVAAALVLLPPLVQAAYVTAGGFIWQGRYTLPVFAVFVIGIAVVVGEGWSWPGSAHRPSTVAASRRVFATVWAAWGIAQFYCFAIALKRNSVGSDDTWAAMVGRPEWSAPGSNALLLALFAVAVALSAAGAWWVTRAQRVPAG